MNGITIALSKGRIFDETLPLLAAAGIVPAENPETSRKLIIATNRRTCASSSCVPPTCRPTCNTARPISASPARTC
jgi:ATP phosphoribosyltransferase